MRQLCVALTIVLQGTCLVHAESPELRMVVIDDDVPFMIDTEVIETLPRGCVLTVLHSSDGRASVRLSRRGRVSEKSLLPVTEAIEFFDAQIERNPRDTLALNARGSALCEADEYDKALLDVNEVIRLDPQNAGAFCNRGGIWVIKGNYANAISDFGKSIELKPKKEWVYLQRGFVWTMQQKFDHALADCNESIRINPQNFRAFNFRAFIWILKRDFDKAIQDLDESIRIDPTFAENYSDRGTLRRSRDEFSLAIQDYQEYVRLVPESANHHAVLAWLLSTSPDPHLRNGREAIDHARKAFELSPKKDEFVFGSLAVAFAEVGDFDNAVKYAAQALEVCSEKSRMERTDVLELFKSGKPFRQKQKKRIPD